MIVSGSSMLCSNKIEQCLPKASAVSERERERKSANDKESCSVCMPETEENPIFIRQVNIEAANGGCMEYKYPPISHLLKCKCY